MAATTTTATTTMAAAGDSLPASSCPCPQCGFAVPIATTGGAGTNADVPPLQLHQARQQIQALESQVALLDQKAAAAIDRWADYEDELTQLRRRLASTGAGGSRTATSGPLTPASPTRTSFLPAGAATRLSALLSPRAAKSTPNLKAAAANLASASAPPPMPPLPSLPSLPPPLPSHAQPQTNRPTAMPTPPPSATNNSYGHRAQSSSSSPPPRTPYGSFAFFGGKTPPPPPPNPSNDAESGRRGSDSPSTKDLLDALTREQKLRRAAEGRLQDTSREVEELSVSLFEQANEMVAEERRARARLEARVAVLEQRDTDKKRRLERLEQAMDRIERLRAMLGDVAGAGAAAAPGTRDEQPTSSPTRQRTPMSVAMA